METNFKKALEFVLFWEGKVSNREDDIGGLTIFGISSRSHPEEVKQMKILLDNGNEIQAREIAKEIYYNEYWKTYKCYQYPYPVDICVFNFSVNPGYHYVKKAFKEVIPIWEKITKIDKTLRAGAIYYLFYSFCLIDKIEDYLDDMKAWNTFGRGWHKRCLSLKHYIATGELIYD